MAENVLKILELSAEENSGVSMDMIERAIAYINKSGEKPKPAEVVSALLAAEKQSKKAKERYNYDQFVGTWRLGFVSGTKTIRKGPKATPIKRPGAGRFLPSFAKIEITYTAEGTVKNAVNIGPLQLQLTGPTQFRSNTSSLAFDFTHLTANIGTLTVYEGSLRGGEARNQAFAQASLKDQAFFKFFLVSQTCLAARGKGGGLALWTSQLL